MQVDIGGGTIEFTRFMRLGAARVPDEHPDAEPTEIAEPIQDDAEMGVYDPTEFVSLGTGNLLFAALDLIMIERGAIQRIGWANVILESSRSYHYGPAVTVTESIDNLPTWDGDAAQLAPFFSGHYYGAAPPGDHGSEGPLEGKTRHLFNDAPSMVPTRGGALDAEGKAVGLFEREGAYVTSISGRDRYLACLVVDVGPNAALEVAWSKAWEINFSATVTRDEESKLPVVTIPEEGRIRLGTPMGNLNAGALVNAVRAKQASATRKTYAVQR